MLWFDVEHRYRAIARDTARENAELWFDVEHRYRAIVEAVRVAVGVLWFDVEHRYRAIGGHPRHHHRHVVV